MNKERQRIAIAEACPNIIRTQTRKILFSFCVIWQWFDGIQWNDCHQYDPLSDLNAMHEAEKVLTRNQLGKYDQNLWIIVGAKCKKTGQVLDGMFWHATAAQRAEAFLKTLNLWK